MAAIGQRLWDYYAAVNLASQTVKIFERRPVDEEK